MGSLSVKCVGGVNDGRYVSINSSENDYFHKDNMLFSKVVSSNESVSETAFNNAECTIWTTHVSAASKGTAKIDVYMLQGNNDSNPEDVFFKYVGDLSDYLEALSGS